MEAKRFSWNDDAWHLHLKLSEHSESYCSSSTDNWYIYHIRGTRRIVFLNTATNERRMLEDATSIARYNDVSFSHDPAERHRLIQSANVVTFDGTLLNFGKKGKQP